MRSEAARSSETLDAALTKAINGITDENGLNWFNHGGLFLEPIRQFILWYISLQFAVIRLFYAPCPVKLVVSFQKLSGVLAQKVMSLLTMRNA